jgi:hypothetical protein
MSEIENFEGDLFWNADDTESTCDDPYDELLNVVVNLRRAGEGNIVVFEQAKRLPNFYGALINGEERYFESLGEVEEALKEAKNGRV